jgi:hypothetical protein
MEGLPVSTDVSELIAHWMHWEAEGPDIKCIVQPD